MKILADESVDIPVFEFLKNGGFDIEHVSFFSSGSPDADVLDCAYKKAFSWNCFVSTKRTK